MGIERSRHDHQIEPSISLNELLELPEELLDAYVFSRWVLRDLRSGTLHDIHAKRAKDIEEKAHMQYVARKNSGISSD